MTEMLIGAIAAASFTLTGLLHIDGLGVTKRHPCTISSALLPMV
jgi:hypothetical protein